MTNISFKKYLTINAIGFGLGGLLWGLVLYLELPDLEFPFHFMAILIMGLFGGISLVWFDKSIRNISKSVVAGFLGWVVGFVAGIILSYPLYLYGSLLLSSLGYLIEVETLKRIINLVPDIGVGSLWLVFLLIGAIVGFFYALFLKTKIWPLVWRGGLGLGLASLIGPVIGNLIGNLCNSLLVSYLVTFGLIGMIFGKFLAWGVYKNYGGKDI